MPKHVSGDDHENSLEIDTLFVALAPLFEPAFDQGTLQWHLQTHGCRFPVDGKTWPSSPKHYRPITMIASGEDTVPM